MLRELFPSLLSQYMFLLKLQKGLVPLPCNCFLFFILFYFFCLFFPYFFHHFLLCTTCHLQERTRQKETEEEIFYFFSYGPADALLAPRSGRHFHPRDPLLARELRYIRKKRPKRYSFVISGTGPKPVQPLRFAVFTVELLVSGFCLFFSKFPVFSKSWTG